MTVMVELRTELTDIPDEVAPSEQVAPEASTATHFNGATDEGSPRRSQSEIAAEAEDPRGVVLHPTRAERQQHSEYRAGGGSDEKFTGKTGDDNSEKGAAVETGDNAERTDASGGSDKPPRSPKTGGEPPEPGNESGGKRDSEGGEDNPEVSRHADGPSGQPRNHTERGDFPQFMEPMPGYPDRAGYSRYANTTSDGRDMAQINALRGPVRWVEPSQADASMVEEEPGDDQHPHEHDLLARDDDTERADYEDTLAHHPAPNRPQRNMDDLYDRDDNTVPAQVEPLELGNYEEPPDHPDRPTRLDRIAAEADRQLGRAAMLDEHGNTLDTNTPDSSDESGIGGGKPPEPGDADGTGHAASAVHENPVENYAIDEGDNEIAQELIQHFLAAALSRVSDRNRPSQDNAAELTEQPQVPSIADFRAAVYNVIEEAGYSEQLRAEVEGYIKMRPDEQLAEWMTRAANKRTDATSGSSGVSGHDKNRSAPEGNPNLGADRPKPTHSYMIDLYDRLGMGTGEDSGRILEQAATLWASASDTSQRLGIAEAIAGRRFDGWEINEMPIDLSEAIFDGGPYETMIQGVRLYESQRKTD